MCCLLNSYAIIMWEVLSRQIPFEGNTFCMFCQSLIRFSMISLCYQSLITDLYECVCVVRDDQPHADHVQCAAWDASWHESGQSAPWDPQQRNSHQFNDLRLDWKTRWATFLPQWVHTESTHSKDRTLLSWLNLFHTVRGHLSSCWVIDKAAWSGRVLWPWQSSD